MNDAPVKGLEKDDEQKQKISFFSQNYMKIKGELQNELRKVDKFCDFILKTEDDSEINVHKIILISSSEFFADSFDENDAIRRNSSPMVLKGISATCLENLVSYMYTGSITIDPKDLEEVAAYAHYLRLQELDKFCQETLSQMITNSNCIKLWKFAALRLLAVLRDNCLSHILHNATLLFDDPNTLKLEQNEIKIILESDKLNCSEEKAYDFLLKWIKANAKTKPEIDAVFMEMADAIRFPMMRESYIAAIISSNKLFENNINFWKKIGDFIKYKWSNDDSLPVKISKDQTPRIGSRNKDLACICDDKLMNISCNFSFSSIKILKDRKRPGYTMFGTNFLLISGGESNNTCKYYSPIANILHSFPPLKKPRWNHLSTELDNKIYICGGYEGTLTPAEHIEIYDLAGGQWVLGPNMNEINSNFSITTWNNCLYALGGSKNSVECLDPRTHTWRVICNTYPFTDIVKSISVDDAVHCFSRTSRCVFDPRMNKFGNLVVSPVKYSGSFDACNLNNVVYTLGSISENELECHQINFESNSWKSIWKKEISSKENIKRLATDTLSTTSAFGHTGQKNIFSYNLPIKESTTKVTKEFDLALVPMYLK